jgi:hypothetical protein
VLTELLTPVYVGHMHLDRRDVSGKQRIHQRYRGGVARRIDHDALGATATFLHP